MPSVSYVLFFFFQAEDGIRDLTVTGVQTCALPISASRALDRSRRRGGAGLERARPTAPGGRRVPGRGRPGRRDPPRGGRRAAPRRSGGPGGSPRGFFPPPSGGAAPPRSWWHGPPPGTRPAAPRPTP